MVDKIRCDTNDVKLKYEAGQMAEEERDMMTEDHEELLRDAMEIADVDVFIF